MLQWMSKCYGGEYIIIMVCRRRNNCLNLYTHQYHFKIMMFSQKVNSSFIDNCDSVCKLVSY